MLVSASMIPEIVLKSFIVIPSFLKFGSEVRYLNVAYRRRDHISKDW